MSLGAWSFGGSSFGANPSSGSPPSYGKRIAVIGDSNASGRGISNQPITGSSSSLYNNAGSVVALPDPWDGGTNTYAVLDDSSSATGSYIPRLAQHYTDASITTLWIPANKGGTGASDWAYSTSTSTCYGAMKARIDAAGGVDIIIMHLGSNDAISSVSGATFISQIEGIVGHLATDFPGVEIYLQKINHFTGYTSQIDVIRAAINDLWNGSSGVLPGADLDGITTDVHYASDGELTAVADATYAVLTAVGGTASVTLVNSSNVAQSSLTGLKWAWFDQTTPDNFAAPTDKGAAETTDGSGVLTVSIPNSTRKYGQTGWLVVTNSDGTVATAHKAFSGPVVVG